jgi:hypothetical protein
VDETGLFWHSFPENTQACRYEVSTPWGKTSNERIKALLCANADSSHLLTPITFGKSCHPRVLEDCMNQLPVIYHNLKKTCFTSHIFHDWCFEYSVPEVKRYQIGNLGIPPQNVKVLLLLDNAPAYPSESVLWAQD